MSNPATPVDNVNSLVISVNREGSCDKKSWYAVEDWTETDPLDFSSLPAAIQDSFILLARQGTVGAVASTRDEHGAPIVLYLLNIKAIQDIFPKAGPPGHPIHDFKTNLAHQTILVRGVDNHGADIHYRQITQASWSANPHLPDFWDQGVRNDVDGLITNSNLAFDLVIDADTSITCYLLNLASFTEPSGR